MALKGSVSTKGPCFSVVLKILLHHLIIVVKKVGSMTVKKAVTYIANV